MPEEPKKRNHSVGQSLKCQLSKRQRTNSAMESLEHTTESSAHAGGNNLHKQIHFNDMNVDCIEHIFFFLTTEDQLNFRKVCSTWKAMFKRFWRIDNLRIFRDIFGEPSVDEDKEMKMADFCELLKIGGRHLKSLKVVAFYDKNLTNCMRGRINAEEYVIIGQFDICDFLQVIANISNNIQSFVYDVNEFFEPGSFDASSFLAAISKLISRNREIKCFQLKIDYPLAENIKLKDLPESIEDFEINLFVKDASIICDWLSVAKNLRSLSFKRQEGFTSSSDITSQIMKSITYDAAINMKVLQLEILPSPTLGYDMQRIAVMKSLKELHITFPYNDPDVRIDDFLIAISSGCKNLKKLNLSNGIFTCKGMKPILSKLNLTHLSIGLCGVRLNTFLVPQTTLRSLKLDVKINSSSLTKLLQTFKELQFIEMHAPEKMTKKHIRELCAACPRLEHVELKSNYFKLGDQDIHHLLTSLPNLTTAKLEVDNAENIIPSHVDNVNSNIQNLTWAHLQEEHNLAQLTKLLNLRSLTLKYPWRHLKKEEIEAICSGFEKLEEIHFQDYSFVDEGYSDTKVLEEELKSLLRDKPSLRLATIDIEQSFVGMIDGKIILRKQHGMIIKSTEYHSNSGYP